MQDLKLTRWATYLVPGSITLCAFGLLLYRIVRTELVSLEIVSEIPSWIGVLLCFMFGILSYTVGLGLWGLGYSNPIQKHIFRDQHSKL